MSYINWKKAQATDLKNAFWLVKEHGKARKNLSVARIAELMGLDDEAVLYKWIKNGSMPVHKLHSFEHVCGVNYISTYMASTSNQLLIDMPTGKALQEINVLNTQGSFNEAMSLLVKFASNKSSLEETTAALTKSMTDLAFHRENCKKAETPELDFGENNG